MGVFPGHGAANLMTGDEAGRIPKAGSARREPIVKVPRADSREDAERMETEAGAVADAVLAAPSKAWKGTL